MECKGLLEQQKAYCKILNNYGLDTQERQFIEEMAELTQALNKRWRAEKGFIEDSEKIIENIAEEVADVIICLEQIIFALDIKSNVEEWKEKKIKRTLERIEQDV